MKVQTFSFYEDYRFDISMEAIEKKNTTGFEIHFDFLPKNPHENSIYILNDLDSLNTKVGFFQTIPDYEVYDKYLTAITFGIEYGYAVYKEETKQENKIIVKIPFITRSIAHIQNNLVNAVIQALWSVLNFRPKEAVTLKSNGESTILLPHNVKTKFVNNKKVVPLGFYNDFTKKYEVGGNYIYLWNLPAEA